MKTTDRFYFGKYKGMTLAQVMATHGSYVGWCIDNIPNFHIEPKDMEIQFLRGYRSWEQDHKGKVVHYVPPESKKDDIDARSKAMLNHLKTTLDNRHADEMINSIDDETIWLDY